MKNRIALFIAVSCLLLGNLSKAQTAMQFSGVDCDGNNVDLFADLDAGKAVVLFYYMPSCGSCPPQAKKIRVMANNINAAHPNSIKAYAFPYTDATTCSYSQSWVTTNTLADLFVPMDSGAAQVAHYGGFGMPTVVLVGGADHRTMFSTLSFATSDTTIMKDSIVTLLGFNAGTTEAAEKVTAFNVFPNPSVDNISLGVELNQEANVRIDVLDISGKVVITLLDEEKRSTIQQKFDISSLPDGNYVVRLNVDGKVSTRKLAKVH